MEKLIPLKNQSKELLSLVIDELKASIKTGQVEKIQVLTNLLALLDKDNILERSY